MSDLAPKILTEIRDQLRELTREVRTGFTRVDEHFAVLGYSVDSHQTRLSKVERLQKERTFLPRRVDALESKTEANEARIEKLEDESTD